MVGRVGGGRPEAGLRVEARKAKALNRQAFTNSCSDERKDRRQTTLRRGRKASASLKASTAVNKNRR